MMHIRNSLKYGLLLVAQVLIVGCAPQSYVVLLENTDGSVGEVTVKSAGTEAKLATAGASANVDGAPVQAFKADEQQIQKDFAGALQARPALPETFLLYFESSAMQLTADSNALIPKIKTVITQRKAVDISIIGHTDTVGDAKANETLALDRAAFVKTLFDDKSLDIKEITLTSHGERNLLIKTADEVAEPRNRRVEVTVR